MARAQNHRYISRPKYTRQSPDCPLVIFSFTALPSWLHCSTSYSSAFAQHCIVACPPLPTSCTRVHPHCIHHPRVSPSASLSLLQVRPLPSISSESQQPWHVRWRARGRRPAWSWRVSRCRWLERGWGNRMADGRRWLSRRRGCGGVTLCGTWYSYSVPEPISGAGAGVASDVPRSHLLAFVWRRELCFLWVQEPSLLGEFDVYVLIVSIKLESMNGACEPCVRVTPLVNDPVPISLIRRSRRSTLFSKAP